MGILLFTSNVGSIIDPAALSPEELYSIMWEGFTENIVTVCTSNSRVFPVLDVRTVLFHSRCNRDGKEGI